MYKRGEEHRLLSKNSLNSSSSFLAGGMTWQFDSLGEGLMKAAEIFIRGELLELLF